MRLLRFRKGDLGFREQIFGSGRRIWEGWEGSGCYFFPGSAPEQGGQHNLPLGSREAADPELAEFWGAAPYPVRGVEILQGFFF